MASKHMEQEQSLDPQIDLVAQLLRRGISRQADGESRLRQMHPDASEESLRAAAFHLYRELPIALVSLLAEIEISLREDKRTVGHGIVWDAIYHLYNWLQLSALLPWYHQDISDQLSATLEALEGGDTDFAIREMKKLRDKGLGSASPPTVGEDGDDD